MGSVPSVDPDVYVFDVVGHVPPFAWKVTVTAGVTTTSSSQPQSDPLEALPSFE